MDPNPPPVGAPMPKCRDCGSPMQRLGIEKFYVEGTSDVGQDIAGAWGESDSEVLPIEIGMCPACRRLELWMSPAFNPGGPGRGRGMRYACPGCGGDVYQGQTACPVCGHALSP